MKKFKIKYIRYIITTFWWILIILMIALLANILSAKMRGKVPNVLGYSVMKIVSGSMEPQIPTNSYILVKKCKPNQLQKGDVISFYSEDPVIYGLPNTHRIVEKITSENGEVSFTTKGDANAVQDTLPAKEERVIGRYVGNIAWLTSFSNALSGNMVFALLIVFQVGTISLILCSFLKPKKEKGE